MNKMCFFKKYASVGLIVISLLYSLSFIFWTLPVCVQDAAFWYNRLPFYSQDIMECFSLWVGNLWTLLFRGNITALKLLGWLCVAWSLCIPYFLLQEKKKWSQNLAILALGFIYMTNWTLGLFNPDSFTLLFNVSITVWLLKRDNIRNLDILFIAVLSALSVSARFPNVLIIIIITIFLLLRTSRYKSGIYIAVSLLIYLLVQMLLTGNVDTWGMLKNSFSHETGSGHAIDTLMKLYLHDTYIGFCTICTIIGYIYICKQKVISNSTNILTDLFVIIGFMIVIYFVRGWGKICMYSVIFLLIWKINRSTPIQYMQKVLLIIGIGLVCSAGSNVGLGKSYPYFACFIPLILIENKDVILRNNWIKGLICFFVLYSSIEVVTRIPFYDKNECFYKNLCCFDKYSSSFNSYEFFPQDAYEILLTEVSDVRKFGYENHNYFYGVDSHRVIAATKSKLYFSPAYHQGAYDKKEIEKFCSFVLKDSSSVAFDYSKSKIVYKTLISNGYSIIKNNNHETIYKRDR